MTNRLIVTAMVLIALPFNALGEDPSFQPKLTPLSAEELTQAVFSIEAQLKELLSRGSGVPPAEPNNGLSGLRAELDRVKENVRQLGEAVAGNTSNLRLVIDQQKTMAAELQAVSTGLNQITANQQELTSQIREVNVQLGQIRISQQQFQAEITDQISEINTQMGDISRDVGGSRTLRFDNIQDPRTRKDLQNIVNETTPRSGEITVENKMSTGQRIFVNRVEYYLSPGEEEAIRVPSGNVSTQLPGQAVVNWSISAPKYRQSIQIVPERTPPRVTRSVRVSPPVYYESPPVYVEPYVAYVPSW